MRSISWFYLAPFRSILGCSKKPGTPHGKIREIMSDHRRDRALAMAPNGAGGRGGAVNALLLAAEAERAAAPDERSEIMASIRATSPEIQEIMDGIMRKPRLSPGDRTRCKVCAYLLDRVDGKALPDALGAAEAAGLSALLAAARRANAERQGEAPTAAPLKAAAAEMPPQRDPRAALPDTAPAEEPTIGETLPEPVHEAEAAAPEPAKPKAPLSGAPAGFAEFAARREAQRKRLAGGNVHAKKYSRPIRPKSRCKGRLKLSSLRGGRVAPFAGFRKKGTRQIAGYAIFMVRVLPREFISGEVWFAGVSLTRIGSGKAPG